MTPGVAQSIPAARAQSSSATRSRTRLPPVPGGERSIKGCIVRDADGGYFLVSQRGGRVKLLPSEDLAPHIGQQVKTSGAFVDTHKQGESASPSTAGPSSRRAVHPEREFRVLKIDVLSQTCVLIGGKKH